MGHGTRGATRPATGTAARPAAGAGGTAVYLYGVARDLDPAALDGATGVAGAPVRGVVAGDLTALVSTVKTDEYGERRGLRVPRNPPRRAREPRWGA